MISKIKQMFGLDEKTPEADVEKFVETLKQPSQVEAAYDEGLAAGVEKGRAEAVASHADSITEYEKKLKDFTAQISAQNAEIETLKKTNCEQSEKLDKMAAGLKAPEAETPASRAGYFALVEKEMASGMSGDDAHIKVQREHPEIFKVMLHESR